MSDRDRHTGLRTAQRHSRKNHFLPPQPDLPMLSMPADDVGVYASRALPPLPRDSSASKLAKSHETMRKTTTTETPTSWLDRRSSDPAQFAAWEEDEEATIDSIVESHVAYSPNRPKSQYPDPQMPWLRDSVYPDDDDDDDDDDDGDVAETKDVDQNTESQGEPGKLVVDIMKILNNNSHEIHSPQPVKSVPKILRFTGTSDQRLVTKVSAPSGHNSRFKLKQMMGADVGGDLGIDLDLELDLPSPSVSPISAPGSTGDRSHDVLDGTISEPGSDESDEEPYLPIQGERMPPPTLQDRPPPPLQPLSGPTVGPARGQASTITWNNSPWTAEFPREQMVGRWGRSSLSPTSNETLHVPEPVDTEVMDHKEDHDVDADDDQDDELKDINALYHGHLYHAAASEMAEKKAAAAATAATASRKKSSSLLKLSMRMSKVSKRSTLSTTPSQDSSSAFSTSNFSLPNTDAVLTASPRRNSFFASSCGGSSTESAHLDVKVDESVPADAPSASNLTEKKSFVDRASARIRLAPAALRPGFGFLGHHHQPEMQKQHRPDSLFLPGHTGSGDNFIHTPINEDYIGRSPSPIGVRYESYKPGATPKTRTSFLTSVLPKRQPHITGSPASPGSPGSLGSANENMAATRPSPQEDAPSPQHPPGGTKVSFLHDKPTSTGRPATLMSPPPSLAAVNAAVARASSLMDHARAVARLKTKTQADRRREELRAKIRVMTPGQPRSAEWL